MTKTIKAVLKWGDNYYWYYQWKVYDLKKVWDIRAVYECLKEWSDVFGWFPLQLTFNIDTENVEIVDEVLDY